MIYHLPIFRRVSRLSTGLVALSLAYGTIALSQNAVPPAATRAQLQVYLDDAYRFYQGDLIRGDSLFTEVLAQARRLEWRAGEAGANKVLGIVKYLRGDYDEALPHYQRALDGYEALGDGAGQAAVLNEMGVFFHKRGDLARAHSLLQRGGELALAARDTVLYGNSLDLRGQFDLRAERYEVAGERFAEVLRLRRIIGDSVGLGYVYDNLATLAVNTGDARRALVYLDSSIAVRRALGDRHAEAIAVNNQGEALLTVGDTAGAVAYLERSADLSRAVGFTDLHQWTLGLLSGAYASGGRLAEALAIERASQAIKDSLYRLETTTAIAEMQERYESEKRERELAEERAAVRQRTAWLIAAVLGIVALALTLLLRARAQAAKRERLEREAEERLRRNQLRISRDLHDHLGAELGLVASQLGRIDREEGSGRLAAVTAQVREAMQQMRETIWAVRTDGGTWADLFARLRTFGDRLGHPGLRFELDAGLATQSLEADRMLEVYRLTQEALRNAVHHASAANIVVRADASGLTVTDDGVGTAAAREGSYGLASMRERAAELGAEFSLTAEPNAGTEVALRWA